MRHLKRFLTRLGEWLRNARTEDDLTAEIDSHVAFLSDEYERRGLAPAEARRRALLDVGGRERARELVRDARGFRPLDELGRDMRDAVRLLARAPGFAATVVVTLALGIGANTAIFSLVDAVVLRPLPYPESDRLVSIWENVQALGEPAGSLRERIVVAPANFADYEARAASFDAMAAFQPSAVNLTGADRPERLVAEVVSPGYFDVFGRRPALGRPFAPGDFAWGSHRVVVLADGLWRRIFGADPAAIGRTVRLDGAPFEIVGVMPRDFVAPTQHETDEPVSMILPLVWGPGDNVMTNRQDHRVDVVARLGPDVSIERAAAELTAISDALGREFPEVAGTSVGLSGLRADQVRDVKPQMVGLLVAVGLVLLIACVNLAALMMVRSLARRREVAIRTALGASRGRLMRGLLTQSVVLAGLGALAGLAVAFWTRDVLVSLAPSSLPYAATAALDGRVLGVAAGLAVATALVFGLLPAWQAGRARPNDALRATERVVADRWLLRSHNGLLVAEVALSLVLLVGSGLMLRSLAAFNRVDLGFEPDGVLAANVALPRGVYDTPAARLAFFEAAAERLRATPGVEHATFATRLPLRGSWGSGFELERPAAPSAGPDDAPEMDVAGFQAVSPDFFDTLSIRLARGRRISRDDRTGREPVAVVSEAFGRDILAGADPIGHRFRRGPVFPWITIVGVVEDIRRGGRAAEVEPQVYLAAAQTELYPPLLSDLAVKASGDPGPIAEAIRQTVWALDPDQPVTNVRTLEDTLSLRQADRRFQTFLFTLFAAVALALSTVGAYGVVAYAVSQRTAEIGLRLALGASPARVVAWMIGQTGRLLAAGAAIGLVAAVVAARYVASLLFGITPMDPATYAGAALVLGTVVVGAAWLAARRATRVDPAEVLRSG